MSRSTRTRHMSFFLSFQLGEKRASCSLALWSFFLFVFSSFSEFKDTLHAQKTCCGKTLKKKKKLREISCVPQRNWFSFVFAEEQNTEERAFSLGIKSVVERANRKTPKKCFPLEQLFFFFHWKSHFFSLFLFFFFFKLTIRVYTFARGEKKNKKKKRHAE